MSEIKEINKKIKGLKNPEQAKKRKELYGKLKEFTDDEIVALIHFVSVHPAIYNPADDGHKKPNQINMLFGQFIEDNGLEEKYKGKHDLLIDNFWFCFKKSFII
jgi:hypothetical protein